MQERRTVAPVVTTDAGPDAPATPLWSASIPSVVVTDPPRRQRRVWSAHFRLVVASAVATAVIGVDQVAKGLVLRHIGRGESIELMFGVRLVRAFNTGMSFSLGSGSESLKITVFVFALVLIWVARRELGRSVDDPRAPSVLGVTAFGLVIGGALANLVDRAFRGGKGFGRGAVIDFVDVGWWPVFNVADAALVVGCVALLAGSVRDGREGSPAGGKLPNRTETSPDRAEEE